MDNDRLFLQGIATTHLVGQCILTENALRGMANDINTMERKPVVMVEHDILCPPIGVTIAGEVREMGDGHHVLVVVSEMYDEPTPAPLPDGLEGFRVASAFTTAPLSLGTHHNPTAAENIIRIEPINLGGMEGASEFFDTLRSSGRDGFTEGYNERRSQIPDPQIIFDLGANASVLWIGYRIAKVAVDALDPELKRFFEAVFAAIRKSAVEMSPKHRPVTYVLNVQGQPNLQFVARSRDAEMIVRAFEFGDLTCINKTIETAASKFNAEMVQFSLSAEGIWKLNYMISKSGETLGSMQAFNLRKARIAELDNLPSLTPVPEAKPPA